MERIKKNSLWIALLCTLSASLWTALQEVSVDDPLDVPEQNKRANHHTFSKAKMPESKSADSTQLLATPRVDADDFPQNIFTGEIDENDQVVLAENAVEPPLENPFTYAGKIVEDGEMIIFLTDASSNYAVKAGDLINESWQVLTIMPPKLTLRFIPKKVKIQMDIGALN